MEATPLSKDGHRFWMLPATPQTTQFGVYDNTHRACAADRPGDTVAIETEPAGGGQVAPASTRVDREDQRGGQNRGPHTVTGPIGVNGAEPGDLLAIHINRIQLPAYATNNTAKGKGLFPTSSPSRSPATTSTARR